MGDEDDTMIKRVAILVFALLPVGASAQALPVPVRTGPPAGITVFKSLGLAVEDLAAAKLVLDALG